MEDTLRDGKNVTVLKNIASLNPCFNGRYSQRVTQFIRMIWEIIVLILVLMEDTLRVEMRNLWFNRDGLNPCFNGRYSQSTSPNPNPITKGVLILVLMEDTLRVLPCSMIAKTS